MPLKENNTKVSIISFAHNRLLIVNRLSTHRRGARGVFSIILFR